MGSFVYDSTYVVEIEDRTLAHLRIAVMNKLRRSEPFMFEVTMDDGSGHRSYWMHPAVSLQFRFHSSRYPPINREWVELLIAQAGGPNELTLLPEPVSEAPEELPTPSLAGRPITAQ